MAALGGRRTGTAAIGVLALRLVLLLVGLASIGLTLARWLGQPPPSSRLQISTWSRASADRSL